MTTIGSSSMSQLARVVQGVTHFKAIERGVIHGVKLHRKEENLHGKVSEV